MRELHELNPGVLRRRVSIEKYDVSRDTDGSEIRTPTTLANVWASIEPLTGRELLAAQQIHAEVTFTLLIRYRPDVRGNMRVRYGPRVFEILVPLHDEQRHTRTELLCKEIDG